MWRLIYRNKLVMVFVVVIAVVVVIGELQLIDAIQ